MTGQSVVSLAKQIKRFQNDQICWQCTESVFIDLYQFTDNRKIENKEVEIKKKDFYVSKFKITCIRTNQQLVFTEKKKVIPVMILILYYP